MKTHHLQQAAPAFARVLRCLLLSIGIHPSHLRLQFKSSLPPETADLLTSERLPLLLQTNAGSGLPLTEH